MATTNTPNMNLPLPIVGVEPGPQYGADQNSAFTLIDAHNHSVGSGVQITPDGININENFPFNGFSATSVLSVLFNSMSSALSGNNFISCVGGNLYFNDGSGNQIQITSGGGVAGSPGSIGSLASPAAATYSSGSTSFVWTAASNKAAAMDNGAVTIRETNVSSAKGITLTSPTSLASDLQLTLPSALPNSNQYMTSNTSGALSFSTPDSVGSAMTSVGSNAIATSMTSTGANSIGSKMNASSIVSLWGTAAPLGGIMVSNFSGSVNYTGTIAEVASTVLVGTLVVSGNNPVSIRLLSGTGGSALSTTGTGQGTSVRIKSNGSVVGELILSNNQTTGGRELSTQLEALDFPTAGTITYQIYIQNTSVNVALNLSGQLIAQEM